MVHGPVNGGTVWIFQGDGARLPSAVFPTRSAAETWIKAHRLSGLLTEYPLGESVYDWAVRHGHFVPRTPEHSSAKFVAGFTSAHLPHAHFSEDSEDL
jgi:hypothetical protein